MMDVSTEIAIYQKVAEILVSNMPQDWSKLVFQAKADEDLISMSVLHEMDGEVMPYISLTEFGLGNVEVLDTEVRSLWDMYNSRESSPWKIFTLTLETDGKFTTNFDYDAKLGWED